MAGAPNLKVYTSDNEYVASFNYYEDAAMFAGFRGNGSTVRFGHQKSWVLWTEGAEEFPAGESLDRAAEIMRQRLREKYRLAYIKVHGREPDEQ